MVLPHILETSNGRRIPVFEDLIMTATKINTAQLSFDIFSGSNTPVSRNSRSRQLVAHTADPSSNATAAETLAKMPVDDRVFSLGLTNWKSLLDYAFKTGHTELTVGPGGVPALRKPGYAFAAITRMPECGRDYIRQLQGNR